VKAGGLSFSFVFEGEEGIRGVGLRGGGVQDLDGRAGGASARPSMDLWEFWVDVDA